MQFNAKQLQTILDENVKDFGCDKIIEWVFNSLMKSERKTFLLENKSSKNKGNGYRERCMASFGGKIEFKIPRDRFGQFYPLILEIMNNQEERIKDLSFELYGKGMTTRDVSEILTKTYGGRYKKSTISSISQDYKESLEEWRNRPLDLFYPIVMVDALYTKIRRAGTVESEAFYIVVGVRKDKSRDILAIESIPTESATGWGDLLEGLKARGLEDTKLIIADGLTGLENAVSKVFKSAKLQKCVTHFKRQLLNKVRTSDKPEVSEDLKKVFQIGQESYSKEMALQNFEVFIQKWGAKYRYIKGFGHRSEMIYYFTFLDFNHNIQKLIYTTNWIEGLNKSFRRVLKFRNSMPSDESVLLLLSKVAMDKVDKFLNYPVYNLKFDKTLFPGE